MRFWERGFTCESVTHIQRRQGNVSVSEMRQIENYGIFWQTGEQRFRM